MNVKRFLGKCIGGKDVVVTQAAPCYSQAGEDMVIHYFFSSNGIQKPTYLDIGTNHPSRGNNTYFFYLRGSRGVCIEPDADLCKIIRSKRGADTVLNAGIGIKEEGEADFYLFPGKLSAWNTFSPDDAKEKEVQSGIKPRLAKVPLLEINSIIQQHFQSCPNFISLDVEGLDLPILQSFDFNKYRPEIFCVETISFSLNNKGVKIKETIDFMHGKGYITYADTHINTIFCKAEMFT